MPNVDFEATKGLLEDDILRQAGRIEKAWLEALMNSVDAGASHFTISISEGQTLIEDDGRGMDETEVDKYYRQFGYKDDDTEQKTFGEFRRGRGQLFAYGVNVWHTLDNVLVVNVKGDTCSIEAPIDPDEADRDASPTDDGWRLNTEGLGFNHQPADSTHSGTKINIQHYDPIEDVESKVDEFKDLARYISWMQNIDVTVNHERLDHTFSPDLETEYCYASYNENSISTRASLYNMGAFVNKVDIKDDDGDTVPVQGDIITKHSLRLNNARTEVIEGDETWEQVKEDYVVGAAYYLADSNDLNRRQKRWLIKQSATDDELLSLIKDRDIIDDVNGNSLSLSDLEGAKVAFGPSGDNVAQDVMNRGDATVIEESYAEAISKHAEEKGSNSSVPPGQSYEDMVENTMTHEMSEYDESNLSKRRKQNIQKIRWLMKEIGEYSEVKPGHSQHKNVWRTDSSTLYIDKDYLNSNKTTFATEVVDEVVRVAAAEGDTRKGVEEDYSHARKYRRYMKKLSSLRMDLLQGNVPTTDQPQLS